MTPRFALLAGVLLGSLTAGNLLAQTTAAPTKPSAGSSMQHSPSANSTTHQDTTKVSSAKPGAAQHATWSKAQIKEAQQGLIKAGYYKGKASGELNHGTRSALKAFQKANKLPVTGRLSNDVLTRLRTA